MRTVWLAACRRGMAWPPAPAATWRTADLRGAAGSGVGEHALDVGAAQWATLFALHQRATRLEDGLHRRALAAPEHGGDLLVSEAAELAHHERATLAIWQRTKVADELVQPRSR